MSYYAALAPPPAKASKLYPILRPAQAIDTDFSDWISCSTPRSGGPGQIRSLWLAQRGFSVDLYTITSRLAMSTLATGTPGIPTRTPWISSGTSIAHTTTQEKIVAGSHPWFPTAQASGASGAEESCARSPPNPLLYSVRYPSGFDVRGFAGR